MVRVAGNPDSSAIPQPASTPVPSNPPPPPARWSNRAVAGVIVGIMAVLATVALLYALETVSVRRGHDVMKPPRSEFIQVPLLLRVALGVYLFILAFVISRSYFQQQRTPGRPRRFLVPVALTAVGAVLVVLLLQPRRNPEPEPVELIPVRPVPPAELSGLGYLPDNVNFIAGIHVAEALQTATGQALLSGLHL
jgi:hypothetical protein